MTATLETIALRLLAFIHAVERNAGGRMPLGIRTQPRTGGPNDRPKNPILATYEECLGKLTDAECSELDRIIQKMSGGLGSPPGAIEPQ